MLGMKTSTVTNTAIPKSRRLEPQHRLVAPESDWPAPRGWW